MIGIDYKVVSTVLVGKDTSSIRTIYTTEYPCLLWIEIEPGQLPGFNQAKECYYDVQYTGDRTATVRTYLFITDNIYTPGNNVGYCPRSGIAVRFNTGDDDYSGIVRIHVMRLPTPTT